MADRDDQPSLELPSLSGWRRRRRTREPEPAPEPVTEPEPELPLEPSPEPGRSGGEQATIVLPEPVADAPPDGDRAEGRRATRLQLRRPGAHTVVVLTGLLVGLAIVGLTWASLRTCEQVQGTSSCGRAGYPMLGVVLALAVLVGALLLRAGRVPDAATTSVLGVGLAAVVTLLFLVDQLDRPATIAAIPVIAAITFAAAHWVTSTFIEPGNR